MMEQPKFGTKRHKNRRKVLNREYAHVPRHHFGEWVPPRQLRADDDLAEQLESLWDCE
jgi:hypothetical protein